MKQCVQPFAVDVRRFPRLARWLEASPGQRGMLVAIHAGEIAAERRKYEREHGHPLPREIGL